MEKTTEKKHPALILEILENHKKHRFHYKYESDMFNLIFEYIEKTIKGESFNTQILFNRISQTNEVWDFTELHKALIFNDIYLINSLNLSLNKWSIYAEVNTNKEPIHYKSFDLTNEKGILQAKYEIREIRRMLNES